MLSAIKAPSEMLYLTESGRTESVVTLITPVLSTVVVDAVSVTVSVFALEHAVNPATAKIIRNFMYIPKRKFNHTLIGRASVLHKVVFGIAPNFPAGRAIC